MEVLLLMAKLPMDVFKLSRVNPGEMAETSRLRSSMILALLRQVGEDTWQG
jgi:hypothetical protein